MMKNKKGVELALNTIIVAVLVLIVLVILVFIFVNKSREFVTGISSCESRHSGNYQCVEDADSCTNLGGRIDVSATCQDKSMCCVLNIDTKL